VYVADTVNSITRKITPAGVVTTIGGLAGQSGSTDGLGSAARFFGPRGIVVDANDNLYIADTNNGTIRKGVHVATSAITRQPTDALVQIGHGLSLSVAAAGSPQPAYQWYLNGQPIAGATSASYQVTNVKPTDAGTYTVSVANVVNSLTSSAATVTVFGAPELTAPPSSTTVEAGHDARFAVTAMGAPAPTYQWYFEGQPITNGTAAEYRIAAAQPANAGSYSVVVGNQYGQVRSAGAILAVHAPGAPAIARQPQGQTMQVGSAVVFTLDANNPVQTVSATKPRPAVAAVNASYQWYHDGVAMVGATDAVLLMNTTTAADSGSYACLVSNASGATLSSTASLSVVNSDNPGRLINQSLLTHVDGLITIGFVIDGPSTLPQRLLIRAVGPALRTYGVGDIMSDPTMTVIQQATKAIVATNAGWSANASDIIAADAQVGAFPLTADSADAAVVATLPVSGGGYTVQVTSRSGKSGNALVELYDATSAYTTTSTRLLNLSCLYQLPANATLSTGFVVGGTTSKTLLIRADGPSLTTFGVGNVMADPQISSVQPLNSSQVLAANVRWGGRRQIAATGKAVNAFPISDVNAADSALLVTVAPGAYTAQISSVQGNAGNVLVEVYEVP
jgi:hypothetical protein